MKTLEKIERNHAGSPLRKLEQLIGSSPALEAVLEQVRRVASVIRLNPAIRDRVKSGHRERQKT